LEISRQLHRSERTVRRVRARLKKHLRDLQGSPESTPSPYPLPLPKGERVG
jgi:hypothetical protein